MHCITTSDMCLLDKIPEFTCAPLMQQTRCRYVYLAVISLMVRTAPIHYLLTRWLCTATAISCDSIAAVRVHSSGTQGVSTAALVSLLITAMSRVVYLLVTRDLYINRGVRDGLVAASYLVSMLELGRLVVTALLLVM